MADLKYKPVPHDHEAFLKKASKRKEFRKAYKETIKKRVEDDPDFTKALLHEAVNLMLDGDSATAN